MKIFLKSAGLRCDATCCRLKLLGNSRIRETELEMAVAWRHLVQRLAIVILFALATGASDAVGAPVDFNIRQQADADGSLSYDVYVRTSGSGSLTAPDGTSLVWPNRIREFGLTYEQMAARIFGQWTIQEVWPFSFTFDFTLADLPVLPVPTITSPANGAVVGTSIPLSWTYSDGPIPEFASMGASYSSPVSVDLDLGDTPYNGHAVFDLAGQSSASVTLFGGGSYQILNFITPREPPNHYISITGSYITYSTPVRLTVVPEPSSLLMMVLGCAALASCRKRHFQPRD